MTELSDLVGLHELSGVSFSDIPTKLYSWSDEMENCQHVSFILDGITYTAIEDPSDGYRSSMKDLIVGGDVANRFAPQKVFCTYEDKGKPGSSYESASDLLVVRDAVTSKVVLIVGTGNTDDYYPYFCAEFSPENMACNAS
jgi:hypothetical protein